MVPMFDNEPGDRVAQIIDLEKRADDLLRERLRLAYGRAKIATYEWALACKEAKGEGLSLREIAEASGETCSYQTVNRAIKAVTQCNNADDFDREYQKVVAATNGTGAGSPPGNPGGWTGGAGGGFRPGAAGGGGVNDDHTPIPGWEPPTPGGADPIPGAVSQEELVERFLAMQLEMHSSMAEHVTDTATREHIRKEQHALIDRAWS